MSKMVKVDGMGVSFYLFRGRVCVIAAELGVTLGYAENGKKLVDRVRGEWKEEFIPERDFDVLTGVDLRDFKALLTLVATGGGSSADTPAGGGSSADTPAGGGSPADTPAGGGSSTAGCLPPWILATARLVILYESGVDLVCLKTDKPGGRELRRYLADVVIPKLRRGEAVLPGAEPPPVFAPATTAPTAEAMTSRGAPAPSVGGSSDVRSRLGELWSEMHGQLAELRGQIGALRVDVAGISEETRLVLSSVRPLAASQEATIEALSRLERSTEELRSRNGLITKEQAAVIRREVEWLADAWVQLDWAQKPGSRRSAGQEIVNDIYSLVDWGGGSAKLERMPAAAYARVLCRLARMRWEVSQSMRRREKAAAAH